ncbi:hypothetical protein AJ80_03442 [Polytolypa hystricis UAMH7299]|uniref:DUF7598 domain-containing protein n=1 Tax=Polytolypa hystricis (strain UAMH7299) TaxID=1447883 RepID=A0A2B7YHP9_POLH7|nr:hypothetical protein AJ80_03442 [Polytolypa hystricis UAMH7299]
MAILQGSLAGPGYVILNIIRAMNIIALLAVIAACSVLLVKTFVISQFFFFDGVTQVIIAFISFFLILSELNFFTGYFNRNWPLFGQDSGFVTLGATMVALGVWILGNLNNKAMSQKSLGLAFWRIVVAAGIVIFVMGVINFVVSFIFREPQVGVTARHVRAHGAVAEQKVITRSSSSKSLRLSRKSSLPTYHSRSSSTRSVSMRHTASYAHTSPSTQSRFPIKISSPVSENQDQFAKFATTPDVTVPNLAHHPAMFSDRV